MSRREVPATAPSGSGLGVAATARPVLATRPVAATAAAVAVVLTAFSQQYGFERDELYFRLLRPAWGYVDQPPLVPLLVHGISRVIDEPWAVRIPATIVVAASVVVVALITRELGGDRTAQLVAVGAYAGTGAVMVFGHVLLTSTFDLLTWPLVSLFVMRGLLRQEGRWWLWAGAVAGLASYDKLLVSWLMLSLAIGLVAVGPRLTVVTPWVVGGVATAALVGLPNLLYQVTHGWPQWAMGRALAANNASDVRSSVLPLMVLLLGPVLVPVWVAGLVGFLRRPGWRPVRCFAPALAVVVVLTFVSGTQAYYPTGLLVVMLAAGAVPTGELVARSRPWRWALITALAANAVVSAVIGLPLIPVASVGATPVPGINLAVADQIGWPRYVAQIASVHDRLPAADRRVAVVIASNYGEAGAVDRYGSGLGLPAVYSAQNALYAQARPPESADPVVVVGYQLRDIAKVFRDCTTFAHLDDGVGVDNEEQGAPVAICRGRIGTWADAWPRLRHLD